MSKCPREHSEGLEPNDSSTLLLRVLVDAAHGGHLIGVELSYDNGVRLSLRLPDALDEAD